MSRRNKFLLIAVFPAALLLLLIARPVIHLGRAALSGKNQIEQLPPGFADDISRMNRTRVAQIWDIPAEPQEGEKQLRQLLHRAHDLGLHVSIAGARHSMGGQTIAPGGIEINMLPFRGMVLDEKNNILHVQAGAKWADVIPFLDRHGRSVWVMQSDNAFTVGGSLSVNCHGWQYGRPPIASTVESFHLMKADGTVVRCSRTENKELFSLALGGYGLFGIILDADLHVVPNTRLHLEQYLVPAAHGFEAFDRRLREKQDLQMAYGRLNITPSHMFDEAVINMFYPEPGPVPPLGDQGSRSIARAVFRGSVGSAFGKELRWSAETKLLPHLSGSVFSRNQLLNDIPDWYLDHSAATTDILHEYFVPRENASRFLSAARKTIRNNNGDLLNVTVRDVQTDDDSFLRYARRPLVAFVMFFSQPRSLAGDAQMQQMTQELIDDALETGGTYYLPYRLHATPEQFRRAYPQADDFFAAKRRYDPGELFQNQFYLKYGVQTRLTFAAGNPQFFPLTTPPYQI